LLYIVGYRHHGYLPSFTEVRNGEPLV
jgi:hypothetical protein